MSPDRVERLIRVILSSSGSETDKTERIQMILNEYRCWAERQHWNN